MISMLLGVILIVAEHNGLHIPWTAYVIEIASFIYETFHDNKKVK